MRKKSGRPGFQHRQKIAHPQFVLKGHGFNRAINPSREPNSKPAHAALRAMISSIGVYTLANNIHEQSFVADISSWINSILERTSGLPFRNAKVEEYPHGKRTRRDLSIYDKDGKVAICGEVKMPDAPDGKTPYDEDVVQDAFLKSSQSGARFFFTWNVNRLVIFDPSKVTLPILQRQTKDYKWFTLTKSVEVRSPSIESKLRNEYLPSLLQDLASLYRGETPFGVLPPDERFILMLESFLERPVELTRKETYRRWHDDNAFRKDISAWMVNSQKWTIPKNEFDLADLLDRASKLSCYILANKLIFYEALRHRFPLTPISIPNTVDSVDRMYGRLAHFFQEAQKVTEDYETIFWPDYGAKLPLFAPGAIDAWKSITHQIALFKLGSLQYDVLGPIFQRLIDKDSKHKYGQHYTQPTIVDVINSFTIRRADAVVMDPGCGSGTFLIRAYARKRWLDPTMDHATAISQLYGIDWSGFAVHLAALGLASQDMVEANNYPRVVREDFFNVAPAVKFMALPLGSMQRSSGLGSKQVEILMPTIQAGVGNPPYIRQEEIEKSRKDSYQNLIRKEAPELKFSGRSDIYVYFWPHLNTFLHADGMMGLLTSSSWLDVEYGFRLQGWFLDHFKILAILESVKEPWFEGARVSTAVTIIQPCADSEQRNSNKVKFVQLRVPLADLLENDGTEDGRQRAAERLRDIILKTNRDKSTEQYRILVRTQSELYQQGIRDTGLTEEAVEGEEEETGVCEQHVIHAVRTESRYEGSKWGVFLRAPDLYFELMMKHGSNFVPLEDLAEIRFGVKSGCDDFFFPMDITKEALELEDKFKFQNKHGVSRTRVASGRVKIVRAGDGTVWPIEAEYLQPEVHSSMGIESLEIRRDQIKRHILLVNKHKSALKHKLVLAYIEYGERENFGESNPVAERSTCKARTLWYDVTGGRRGDVFWPMIHKYRHIVASNPEKLICNHNLFDVTSSYPEIASALPGVLNSTLVAFLKQFYGRAAGMEGTLKTEVVDVKMLLVPNLKIATASQLKAIGDAFEKLAKRPSGLLLEDSLVEMVPVESIDRYESMPASLPQELRQADRQELDRAVLSMVGVHESELDSVLNNLYNETTLIYRRGRLLDIKTAKNKRGMKRGNSTSALEVADSVWENINPKELRAYPENFLVKRELLDHYSLPNERPKLIEDLFHRPRIRFKSEEVEFRHLEQAKLAEALVKTGLYGTLAVPQEAGACIKALKEWTDYITEIRERLEIEISNVTPDEAKSSAAANILMRRVLQFRPSPSV
jgi:hypothetical protein